MNREDCDLYEYLVMTFCGYIEEFADDFINCPEENPYYLKSFDDNSLDLDTD